MIDLKNPLNDLELLIDCNTSPFYYSSLVIFLTNGRERLEYFSEAFEIILYALFSVWKKNEVAYNHSD